MSVENRKPVRQATTVASGVAKSLDQELEAVGHSGAYRITNGLVARKTRSTRGVTVSVVFVFGVMFVLLAVLLIEFKHTTLMAMPTTTKPTTLYLYATSVTGRFMPSVSSRKNNCYGACSWCGLMAEVKSRKKSGTLRWESEVKARSNILVSHNDYKVIPLRWTIILARGRDTWRGEKIVWTAVNMKLQNARIKSRTDNKSIPYQRGAKAIARQVNRETKGNANMTEDQARSIIDSWYARYALVSDYVDWCKQHVNNPPHYLETPWGRRRHFYMSPNKSVMAAQEREAVNFPIQSTVADALNMALFNLWAFRRQHPEYAFRILMSIHDAVLLEVPIGIIGPVVDDILPACMVHGARIPQGERNVSFQLDIDSEVMFRWGETPKRKELEQAGVPEQYWPSKAA